MFSRKLSDIE
jgi:serine/threonine protein kinase